MEKLTFFVNKKIIYVNLVWTNNKNMYLKVDKNNEIVVRAPIGISEKKIKSFVGDNIARFSKYVDKSKANKLYSFKDNFVYLFGKKIKLQYMSNVEVSSVRLSGDSLWLLTKTGSDKENAEILNNHMKKEVELYISKRQRYWEKEMNIPLHTNKVSFKTTTWGTNNIKTKTIRYSWKLAHYNSNVIDYLIVHELSHYIHHNHSDDFWKEVSKYLPTYKLIRKQLKANEDMKEE